MFFDDHPEFLETSRTATSVKRLNMRHRMMIEQNAEILRGKRVLDIASHDGRWSFAALEAGAAHVTGVEGRPELVENAKRTITAKGVDPSRFTFIATDIHDFLNEKPPEVDVVQCFGFIYHTLRYPELFAGIRATGAQRLIIDTRVLPDVEGQMIRVSTNPVQIQSMAVEDRLSHGGFALAGTPTMEALSMMLGMYGYEVDSVVNWKKEIRALRQERGDEKPGKGSGSLGSYARGERVTFTATLSD